MTWKSLKLTLSLILSGLVVLLLVPFGISSIGLVTLLLIEPGNLFHRYSTLPMLSKLFVVTILSNRFKFYLLHLQRFQEKAPKKGDTVMNRFTFPSSFLFILFFFVPCRICRICRIHVVTSTIRFLSSSRFVFYYSYSSTITRRLVLPSIKGWVLIG